MSSPNSPVSYLIVGENKVLVQDEDEILSNLVEKYTLNQVTRWSEIVKEYRNITTIPLTVEDIKRKWRNLKDNATIRQAILSEDQVPLETPPFQVTEHIEDNEKTSTTIVLLDSEELTRTEKVDLEHQIAESDLVSVAIRDSGISDNNLFVQEDIDGDYEDLAIEILNADKDYRIARKRLKIDRKFRILETGFEKKKRDIEIQTEEYKRGFEFGQGEILSLEFELKRKQRELQSIKDQIKEFKT